MNKIVIPNPGAGFLDPNEELVGFQTTKGGGLTNTNFIWDYGVTEKIDTDYPDGVFSDSITLDTLNVDLEQARAALAIDLKVYPSYDLTDVTNFTLYGSLTKRLSTSVRHIINFFPAAIEIDKVYFDYSTGYTATNIVYNQNENFTSFDVDVARIKNTLDIDYTVNAERNISLRPDDVSYLRNLTRNYLDYSLFLGSESEEYHVTFFTPSQSLTAGTISFSVSGNPFSGLSNVTTSLVIRPNKLKTEMVFLNDFDAVEQFLLNRFVIPKYTAQFKVPKETENGQFYTSYEYLTWPLYGIWNIDIITNNFNVYLHNLNLFASQIDNFKTNLISRFLITDSFKEFDTPDQKIEKVLQIYGRSFDETKVFIDGLARMTSVDYVSENDIPSALLINLAKTLGWNTNISPISNEDFLTSTYGVKNKSIYEGWTRDETPSELNFEFYRRLILNASNLFKSKGTRKSVEFLMRMIGAPEALIEFNETIYVADRKISYEDFLNRYATISGGTYNQNIPGYLVGSEYKIKGKTYSAFTTNVVSSNSPYTIADYPINENGYTKTPDQTNNFFFQKGQGWYEQNSFHVSETLVETTQLTYTSTTPSVKVIKQAPSFGQQFLDRYRKFPNLNGIGFNVSANKSTLKSESTQTNILNIDDSLTVNVKNVDLFLNVGQGITYDVWEQSNLTNYPIPYTGLTTPYPSPGNIDWTYVNPQPQVKTFAEFAQDFYYNMINVRNRWFTTDGKSSGYPTLQLVYWKYLTSLEDQGITTNKYTYQKMIDYCLGIGDYWTKLVEQVIPSSTIWNGGLKYENSAFHRQKYVYRRQRGCIVTTLLCTPCVADGVVFSYDCIDETLTASTIPWSGTTSIINSFSDALAIATNSVIASSGYTLANCNTSSIASTWYIDLRLDDTILIQQPFFTGYGIYEYPSEEQWVNALDTYLSSIYQYGLNYNVDINRLIISNSGCIELFANKTLTLNVGINVEISCS
jgi:hypothetical protein